MCILNTNLIRGKTLDRSHSQFKLSFGICLTTVDQLLEIDLLPGLVGGANVDDHGVSVLVHLLARRTEVLYTGLVVQIDKVTLESLPVLELFAAEGAHDPGSGVDHVGAQKGIKTRIWKQQQRGRATDRRG